MLKVREVRVMTVPTIMPAASEKAQRAVIVKSWIDNSTRRSNKTNKQKTQ